MKVYSLIISVCFASCALADPTTWYVDQSTGNDTNAAADSTGATPFKHIQAAVNKAKAGDTIVVGDGVYGPDGDDGEGVQTTSLGGDSARSTLAITKSLTLRSENGAGKTIVKGRFDKTTGGVGEEAVRCLVTTKQKIAVEGFTFCNGATESGTASYTTRGGAVMASTYASGYETILVNCVISNCCSQTQGSVYSCALVGCVVKDCQTANNAIALYGGSAYFTVFVGNSGGDAVVNGAHLNCCTFYGNTANPKVDARGLSNNTWASATNCIVSVAPATYITTDNIFVDSASTALKWPEDGDFRPVVGGADDVAAVGGLPSTLLPSGYSWSTIKDPMGNAIDPSALRVGAIQAVAPVETTWYLSPSGDDANNSGRKETEPMRTFAAVFAVAKSNDTVRLAAGDYDYGDIMVYSSYRARVVVPVGIAIEGAGAGKTFIYGAADTGESAQDGCGDNAAMCVFLRAGSKVAHCTLVNGHSKAGALGGGVRAFSRATTAVEYCVISNCVAGRGGGAYDASLYNCLVTACRTTERAAGTSNCEHYNTAVVGNTTTNEAVLSPYVLNNSTVGNNEVNGSLKCQVYLGSGVPVEMNDSLIVGKVGVNNGAIIGAMTNNYVVTLNTGTVVLPAGAFVVKTADELQIDAKTGRPLLGNACIGQADLGKYDAGVYGMTDLYGLPRVINGSLDVGALDADYGPVFMLAAGIRHGEAIAYTGGVLYDEANNRVTLADGASLSFSWSHRADGQCKVLFDIPAGGLVTVARNGEMPVEVASGEEYAFDGQSMSPDALSVAYAGSGVASFHVQDVKKGFVVSVR